MRLLVLAGLFSALACLAQAQVITIPAGTKVALALTSPVWAKSVQLGDSIYAETAFPVTVANAMAIPPGTYVKGQIDIMALRSGHAEFRIQFTQIHGGRTVQLATEDHSGGPTTDDLAPCEGEGHGG